MPSVYPLQESFARGEISPRLWGRTGLDHFKLSLKKALNWIIYRQGGATRRMGTVVLGYALDEHSRLVAFIYDPAQTYAVEISTKIQFFAPNGVVTTDNVNPYQINSPYTTGQIPDLQFLASGDEIFIAHGDVRPQALARTSETNWNVTPIAFSDGPFLNLNLTATTLLASGMTGNITITASDVVGINDDVGFLPSDNGRFVRILTGIAWGLAQITGVVTDKIVNATVQNLPQLLSDGTTVNGMGAGHAPIAQSAWQLSAWSDVLGWPKALGFYLERSTWANSKSKPSTIWASENGGLTSFRTSSPSQDTDALSFSLTGISPILWLQEADDLVYGTNLSMRGIGPGTPAAALSRTNIKHRKGPTTGSSKVQPARVSPAILATNYYGKAIIELVYDWQTDGYVGSEASILSEHLFIEDTVVKIVHAPEPENLVWILLESGKIVAMSYDRAQQMIAFTPIEIAGGADDEDGLAIVEDIVAIPGGRQYNLIMKVCRTINGELVRTIEKMVDQFRTGDDAAEAVFVDGGATYFNTDPVQDFVGATHLAGETCAVLADGGVHDPVEVADDGSFSLDAAYSKVIIGLGYSSKMQTLQMPSGQDGSLIGRKRKPFTVVVDVQNCGPIKISQVGGETEPAVLRSVNDAMDAATPLFTGPITVRPDTSWEKAGEILIEVDANSPTPATIKGIIPQFDMEP